MCKEKVSRSTFIGHDLFGNAYNRKYPPNRDKIGNDFEGYETPNQLTFYYDFCIQQYGVAFYYGDVLYEAEFVLDNFARTARFLLRQNQSVQLRLICIYVCPTSAHRGFRYGDRHYKGNTFTLKTTLFGW